MPAQPPTLTNAPGTRNPARLRFEALSHTATAPSPPIDLDAEPTCEEDIPVCAWIVPRKQEDSQSHQRTFAIYDPHGHPLGEVQQSANWGPLPACSSYRRRVDPLADVRADYPHLADFLAGFVTEESDGQPTSTEADGSRRHQELVEALDRRAPGQQMALFVDRPLALVRARVVLEQDTAQARADQERIDVRRVRFFHGDDAHSGLVGYYAAPPGQFGQAETDYHHLYVGHRPANDAVYLRQADGGHTFPAAGHNNKAVAYVTLLMDPWSTVKAETEVLAPAELRLPTDLVDTVVRRLPQLNAPTT